MTARRRAASHVVRLRRYNGDVDGQPVEPWRPTARAPEFVPVNRRPGYTTDADLRRRGLEVRSVPKD